MKKLIFITFLISLTGCAWITKQIDYAKLCNDDPTCMSQAKSDSSLVSTAVGVAYPVAAIPVGLIAYWISAYVRGRKKEVEPKV